MVDRPEVFDCSAKDFCRLSKTHERIVSPPHVGCEHLMDLSELLMYVFPYSYMERAT